MGLTIHYDLQLENSSIREARKVVAAMQSHALDLPFEEVTEVFELKGEEVEFKDEDRGNDSSWIKIQAQENFQVDDRRSYRYSPKHLIGFSTYPGEGSEEANFGLCLYPKTIILEGKTHRTGKSGWYWGSFCKTQYANNPKYGGISNFLKCHLLVTEMLDHAKSLGLAVEVSDEGKYYENRNVQELITEIAEWDEMIASFNSVLPGLIGATSVISPIQDREDLEYLEARGAQNLTLKEFLTALNKVAEETALENKDDC